MKKNAILFTFLLGVALTLGQQTFAQGPDPDFHIYLCFGQSNMEAGARPAPQDEGFNDPRFQFMAAVDMPRYGREKGHWYTATPPICREGNNLGPVDFFGRKMIENLPPNIRVGVINVSVAGAKLELWDKDAYQEYIDGERDWMKAIVAQYGGSPYHRLLEIARIAQKDGVIKGMLLHQGESNPDDAAWPGRVKKIHDDLCAELGLNPDDIPILAGELKYAEVDGVCAAFNDVVLPHLPEVMPNAHIISALGCESTGDQFHFSTEGMRLMGYRMSPASFSRTSTRASTAASAPSSSRTTPSRPTTFRTLRVPMNSPRATPSSSAGRSSGRKGPSARHGPWPTSR